MSDNSLQFPITDAFLLKYGHFTPNTEIVVDPKYANVDLVTCPGRFNFLSLDPANPKPPVQAGGKETLSATLMMTPNGIGQLVQAIYGVAEKNWDPETRIGRDGSPVRMSASELVQIGLPNGIGTPLVNGTEYWRNSRNPAMYEIWRGFWVMSANVPLYTNKGGQNKVSCKDMHGNVIPFHAIKSGDYGRLSIRLYPTPLRGQKGYGTNRVCALLKGIQLMAPGEALGNYDIDAAVSEEFAKAGDIQIDPSFMTRPMDQGQPAQQHQQRQPAGMVQGFAPPPTQPQMQPPAAMPQQHQQAMPTGYAPAHAQQQQPQYQQQSQAPQGAFPGAPPGAPPASNPPTNTPHQPQMVNTGFPAPPQ